MEFTANQIAELVDGKVEGDSNASVSDFSKIEDARSGTLTFLANPKYETHIYYNIFFKYNFRSSIN